MTDVYDLIEQHFPYDGPHDADTVSDAAKAVAELIRYLNNATGPGNATTSLRWAARSDRLLGHVSAAVYGLDQLLRQLAATLTRQAGDPTLYDDRRDRPGRDTALLAAHELAQAVAHVHRLGCQIEEARGLTHHLGND